MNADTENNGLPAAYPAEAPAPPPAPAPSVFYPLDQRAIGLWRVTMAVTFGVILLASLIAMIAAVFANPDLGVWLGPAWAALVFLFGWLAWWYPPRVYAAWSYRIDGRVLETRSGRMFRKITLLPLSRMQHVDIQRGPLERRYGLASLILHTAGTHAASVTVPGLDAAYAEQLRNWLVEIGADDAV
ncbi:MAG: PH domain-containing protein [Blastocatellia bacterium]